MIDIEAIINRLYPQIEALICEDDAIQDFPPEEVKQGIWDALYDNISDWIVSES